jgi:hypothetical protein
VRRVAAFTLLFDVLLERLGIGLADHRGVGVLRRNRIRVEGEQNGGDFDAHGAELASDVETVQSGHPQSQSDQIRVELTGLFNGVKSVHGFAADL